MKSVAQIIATLFVLLGASSVAFSVDKSGDPLISRRDYWKISLGVAGGLAYGKLVSDVLSKITRGIAYPVAHEERVEATIALALQASADAMPSSRTDRCLRVLEVGIGSDCRVLRRGLYNNALNGLESQGVVSSVMITGVDLKRPSELQEARSVLSERNQKSILQTDFDVLDGDVTESLPFRSGFFDCVLCCLTLCSVKDQQRALAEIERMVRPGGGTFAYVEHVAVEPQEPYRFLEWQQETLDPLQRAVADNCHLHRYTENEILSAFGVNDSPSRATRISHERFLVNDMWPVSCQCSGVVQKRT